MAMGISTDTTEASKINCVIMMETPVRTMVACIGLVPHSCKMLLEMQLAKPLSFIAALMQNAPVIIVTIVQLMLDQA